MFKKSIRIPGIYRINRKISNLNGLFLEACFDLCLTPANRFPSPLVERGQRGEAVFGYFEACFE
jgi:hypothetical protein